MRRHHRFALAATAAVLTATACGAPPAEDVRPPVPPSAPTTAPTSTPTRTPTRDRADVTVTGVVRTGVEAGCLVLDADTEDYLLLGGDRALLRPGLTVQVRGTPKPGIPTTCQQGVPLEVHEVRPP